jgi:N-acylneuraminate cytidylyltransferase
MYQGKSALGLITARGGSKTVSGKNLRPLAGRPLIQWATMAALAANTLDRVILSTDNSEIIAAAKAVGGESPFLRPDNLATDEAETIDVVHHALEHVGGDFDFVVLVQPTSPFVAPEDIDGCLKACADANANSSVSVMRAAKHPNWMYGMDDADRLLPIMEADGARISRRQDLPQAFALNGAVFVARFDWIKLQRDFLDDTTVGYVMPPDRSIDIDTEFDFTLAEAIAGQISP